MEVDCRKPKILRLVDDVAVSSSIEIRSEELTLIGSNSRLLFQRDIEPSSAPSSWSRNEASPKPEQKPTPKVRNDGLSGAEFMFNVLNSTFSVSGVHAVLTSERCGVCCVSGSTVRFSSSSIISAGDYSPFMVRMSRNEGTTFKSTIVLADVIHHSSSDHVAPFVGLGKPQASLTSSTSPQLSDLSATAESIVVVGTGLTLESKHLIGGTGPLFSFGLTEQSSSLAVSGYEMQIETSLLESSLVNVTCSSRISPSTQLFGNEVNQRVVGSCVDQSTNHDSGTGMMSPNMGGNVLCLNTSFSSCISQRNEELHFSFETRTESEIDRLSDVTEEVSLITFTLCTFNDMTFDGDSYEGGAAIYLPYTSSSLTVRTCFFHKCTCDVAFGGSISVGDISSISIDNCFFELSVAVVGGAAALASNDITMSNCAFVECSSSIHGGGIYFESVSSLMISFVQFRECSAQTVYQDRVYGNDICFFLSLSTEVTADSFECCDSTSDSTPTIKSVDVSFNGSAATVTVETDQATKGTMGVLLDGSNVPRLVHVVIGEPTKMATVASVVVSSGKKGILPIDTTYSPRKWSLAPFMLPTVRTADATLKDVNSTEIVLKGVSFEEGSYWMVVENEETERTITLTRSDSTTLTGAASLSLSNGEVSLEWGTQYEVRRVVWLLPDGETEEEVRRSKTITFKTPPDSPLIPPSLLTDVSAHIIQSNQRFAFIYLHFDREVSGSYDFVVEERGEDVTFSIVVESAGTTGETEEFVVVGDSRILTDDTTYTIKSLVATPGSSSTPVVMNDTISFHIPKSSFVPPQEPEEPKSDDDKKAMSPEMKKLLSWLIPLIVSISFVLIVIIVILVLVNRRRAKAINAKSEMEEQEPVELEKVEDVGVDCSNGVIRAEGMSHSNFKPDNSLLPTEMEPQQSSKADVLGELVEVMKCSGDFAVSTVRMDTTLYSVIHTDKKEIGKRSIGLQIVNGLKQVVAHRGQSDVLTQLSSHWILLDSAGNVHLKLDMNSTEAEQAALLTQKQRNAHAVGAEREKCGMNGLRWRAPEVAAGSGQVDGQNASVFSLGLILWEIETGLVPYGEVDAIVAQKQSGTGIAPKLSDLHDDEFVAMLARCLSVNPKERPTLTEVGEFLSSHTNESGIAESRNMAKTQVG
ncbi:hypothetical protein BLNAU_9665 [Blattamonas nauphoetae]|uniref:Protein kinase domain-containing protein n=1 Tax=Blattamonas nauphoetae TaxID=2049346 RepID=A0ABQ9XVE3_9EUKA|nr:hypothetical protein BLNAU_9665 [Blattamonas nauphoetae]